MELILFVITVALGTEIDNTKQELVATQNAMIEVNSKMQAMGEDMFDFVVETDDRLRAMQEQIDSLNP